MSLFRNTNSRGPAPLDTGLSRLLLTCQFDFRQKTWNLPFSIIQMTRKASYVCLPTFLGMLNSNPTGNGAGERRRLSQAACARLKL
jgi:hypothetical protein